MMKKALQLFVVMFVALPAGPALAGPIGDTGSFTWTRQSGYFSGNGGEFTIAGYGSSLDNSDYSVLAKNIANPQSFQTFCIETGEFANTPSHFVVQTKAVAGGIGPSGDQISVGTAWLYSHFAQGTLNVPPISSFGNYFSAGNPTRANETLKLQQAIWKLEGEDNTATTANNAYYAAAVSQFGGVEANAQANATAGYLGVYVLNNWKTAAARNLWVSSGIITESAKAQDFLYFRVPDGGATILLLGAAMAGLAAIRRRVS